MRLFRRLAESHGRAIMHSLLNMRGSHRLGAKRGSLSGLKMVVSGARLSPVLVCPLRQTAKCWAKLTAVNLPLGGRLYEGNNQDKDQGSPPCPKPLFPCLGARLFWPCRCALCRLRFYQLHSRLSRAGLPPLIPGCFVAWVTMPTHRL